MSDQTAGAVFAERSGLLLDALTADSAQDRKNQEALKTLYRNMRDIPWRPASILSFHPWRLNASGVVFNELKVAPAPPGNDDKFPHIVLENGRQLGYTQHVFPNWVRNAKPNDAGALEFTAIMPLDLALDFVGQHQNFQRQGGLVAYQSSNSPEMVDPEEPSFYLASPNGERPPAVPFKQAIEIAHEMQVAFYTKLYDDEEREWASSTNKTRHRVATNVRAATRLLREWGYLATDPEWLKKVQRAGTNAPAPVACKSCGTESKPGALKCTNGTCSYVFDPFGAFLNLVIDLETPGARLALRRLEENRLNELINKRVFTRDAYEELMGFEPGSTNPRRKNKEQKQD